MSAQQNHEGLIIFSYRWYACSTEPLTVTVCSCQFRQPASWAQTAAPRAACCKHCFATPALHVAQPHWSLCCSQWRWLTLHSGGAIQGSASSIAQLPAGHRRITIIPLTAAYATPFTMQEHLQNSTWGSLGRYGMCSTIGAAPAAAAFAAMQLAADGTHVCGSLQEICIIAYHLIHWCLPATGRASPMPHACICDVCT